ncbi:hypothetical protein Pmani_011991 [Petrolisthes manimaculis]|uniref:Major facilitator superfamily (MFS) profile domain-containing protein n=1 Tax=Petrolisthes manimaculis TaxID=1843537 RepID=A0AAE1PYL1_9EUCA|nr:hypothetical protein Pmani_011991 [Petrolisthes manimaculis]
MNRTPSSEYTGDESIELKSCSVDNIYNKKEPEAERRIRLLKQLCLVLICVLGQVLVGITHTWPSPAISSLSHNNASLVGTEITLTTTQIDMTGSLLMVGSLLGSPMAGWLITYVGRRRSLQVSVLPCLTGWLLLALAPNVAVLLTARMIQGFGYSIASLSASTIIMEISDVEVRGMMLALTTIGIVVGGLYTVGFGYILPWYYLSLTCALLPLVLLLGTFFLPYSPSYLLLRGQKLQAIQVLRRLRGPYSDVNAEVTKLEAMNSGTSRNWRNLLKPKILKRLIVVIMLFAFQNFCGTYVFIVHTSRILQAAGVVMDPDLGTVIVGVARIVGCIANIYLVDKIGRKLCLVISHAGNAVTLVMLGAYVYVAEKASNDDNILNRFHWVPLVCMLVIMLALNIGVHPVPHMMAVEYFPTYVRGQAASVVYMSGMLFTFMVLQLYSYMKETLTQAGLYWFYAFISVLAVLFTLAFVKETKGKVAG